MDAIGAQKLDEALRYTPGVLGQSFGVDNDTDWLYIRGFEATQYGTYLDGLQNFSYGFGGFLIDSFGIERIDVLRGASSGLYGGSNPGGIVNYISKRPTDERLLAQKRASIVTVMPILASTSATKPAIRSITVERQDSGWWR